MGDVERAAVPGPEPTGFAPSTRAFDHLLKLPWSCTDLPPQAASHWKRTVTALQPPPPARPSKASRLHSSVFTGVTTVSGIWLCDAALLEPVGRNGSSPGAT